MTEITAGVELNIDIKENARGFEFGLSLSKGQKEKEYLTTIFDAQEVASGKLIKVWRESGEQKASIVLTDGTKHQLTNTKTKHYMEKDRITRKDWIQWAVDLAGSFANFSDNAK